MLFAREAVAKFLVGGNTAGEDDGVCLGVLSEGEGEFFLENVDGGFFETGGEVGNLLTL